MPASLDNATVGAATTTREPGPRPRTLTLGRWVVLQVGEFAGLLAQMLLVGVVLAIWKREFRFRAFAAGLLFFAVAVGAWARFLMLDPLDLGDLRADVLWVGILLFATIAGFVIGRLSRHLGFWESYLAVATTAALYAVHLAVGWHNILGIGADERLRTWDTLPTLGVRLFGPMWDRMVLLCALAAFLLAIFGGSIAFLLYSGGRRVDAGWRAEWFIARRHLTHARRGPVAFTAIVAVGGVAVGVAALVAVTAAMTGYQRDVTDRLLSVFPHAAVEKFSTEFTEFEKVAATVRGVPTVAAVSPFTLSEAVATNGENAIFVDLKGVDPVTAPTVTPIEQMLCAPPAGSQPDKGCRRFAAEQQPGKLRELLGRDGGLPGIVLGKALFDKLGLPLGAVVQVTTPNVLAHARGRVPKRLAFRITGVFQCGMQQLDEMFAYVALDASQELLGLGGAVRGLELKLRNPEQMSLALPAIDQALGGYPYRLTSWRDYSKSTLQTLALYKLVTLLVVGFIIVVAAFNVASTLLMSVVERGHDIALLKAMGARDASVMRVFVIQGWVVAAAGLALGLAIGLGVAALLAAVTVEIASDVYMVGELRLLVRPLDLLLITIATFIISHLATIHPALKAAYQRPVDAMRYG